MSSWAHDAFYLELVIPHKGAPSVVRPLRTESQARFDITDVGANSSKSELSSGSAFCSPLQPYLDCNDLQKR